MLNTRVLAWQLATICCLLIPVIGCSKMDQHTQLSEEETSLREDHRVHSLQIAKRDGWTLHAWLDAGRYHPDDPIGVHLSLLGPAPNAMTKNRVSAELKLKQVAWGDAERAASVDLSRQEAKEANDRWEAALVDAFKSNYRHQGSSRLPLGAYLVKIKVCVNDDTTLSIEGIPMEVLTRDIVESGVHFWKRPVEKESGDLISVLDENGGWKKK
jgi:hypothetical protein